jgi:hypothetical protein
MNSVAHIEIKNYCREIAMKASLKFHHLNFRQYANYAGNFKDRAW